MEAQHYHDTFVHSWHCIWYFFHAESLCLGQGIQRCCTIWNYVGTGLDLVCYQRALERGRQLVGIQAIGTVEIPYIYLGKHSND